MQGQLQQTAVALTDERKLNAALQQQVSGGVPQARACGCCAHAFMCAGASAAAALHAPLCCDVSASPLRARLCAPDNPLRALHQQAADERTAAARKLADATAEHDRQVSKLRADAAVQAAKLEAAKAKEEQQQVRPGLLGACMLCAVVHRPHHAHISPDGCNLLLRCVCAHRSRCSACTMHLRLQTAATSHCSSR